MLHCGENILDLRDEDLDFLEETRHKNRASDLRSYWRYSLLLTVFLALMIKFPLRFYMGKSLHNALFYGTISLACIAAAVRVSRRFGKRNSLLIAIILLCAVLSGWQIFDLLILRTGNPSVYGFGSSMSPNFADHDGVAWYGLRFPNEDIMCHSLSERYFGNYLIAITLKINREATWFACGG
jgi:hypothetical protein